MIEPTETEGKETIDEVAELLIRLRETAQTDPQSLHEAPTRTPVRRLDEVGAARKPVLKYRPPESEH
jgi:glycine dehydrogenase subunit 2